MYLKNWISDLLMQWSYPCNCFRSVDSDYLHPQVKKAYKHGIFESFSYLLSKLNGDGEYFYNQIHEIYRQLMCNRAYLDTLTRSVDSGKQTVRRYEIINKLINELNLC